MQAEVAYIEKGQTHTHRETDSVTENNHDTTCDLTEVTEETKG